MQRKLVTQWREGFVTVENNTIAIHQGDTVIYVSSDQRDAFLTDVEAAPLPTPIKPVGFGGTVRPIAPKSMQQIVDEAELLAQLSTKKK